MRIFRIVCLPLAFLAVSASSAPAQLVDGPVGTIGGLFGGRGPIDPNRTSQTLVLNLDISGGYEQNPIAEGPGEGLSLAAHDWYASTASSTLRYRLGNTRRRLESRGRGIFNYQSNADGWLTGGDAGVNGTLQVGRRQHQLSGGASASYQPGWVFGSLGTTAAGGEDPGLGIAPPSGVLEQRWIVLTGDAGYEHHWTPRHTMTAAYQQQRLRPMEGGGTESNTRFASVEHSWAATRTVRLLGGYRFDRSEQTSGIASIQPVRYQTFEGGMAYDRRLSTTRYYSFSLRAGATRLFDAAASGLRATHPLVAGNVNLAISRNWTATADVARRTVTLLAGISALPVLNDSVEVAVAGTPVRRLRFAISGGYARSKMFDVDSTATRVTEGASATTELRYAVASWAAVFATYRFYHHRIDDEALALSGFPTQYDRHSVRVGLTFWVPLYGAF